MVIPAPIRLSHISVWIFFLSISCFLMLQGFSFEKHFLTYFHLFCFWWSSKLQGSAVTFTHYAKLWESFHLATVLQGMWWRWVSSFPCGHYWYCLVLIKHVMYLYDCWMIIFCGNLLKYSCKMFHDFIPFLDCTFPSSCTAKGFSAGTYSSFLVNLEEIKQN